MANRNRPAVSVTLPADALDTLRKKAEREFRPLSKEIEIAVTRYLAQIEAA